MIPTAGHDEVRAIGADLAATWETEQMRNRVSRVVEGEAFGAPVPGGWPSKGPIEVLRALARMRRRQPDDRGLSDRQNDGEEPPAEAT